MGKLNLSKVFKDLQHSMRKHQPEILTGIGIAGFITTTIMAVKATPKALDLMAEVKEDHECDTDRKAFCKDVLLKVAPVYIPATLVGGLSAACLIGASSINFRRNAALATAYALSESALKDYQEKVVETMGPKKDRAVRDAIAKDKVEQNPSSSKEVIITGKGESLCLDMLSGRHFYSDIDKLKKAENELNYRMLRDGYISVNEFYAEIGLDGIALGYELGWRVDRGRLELDYSAQLDEGVPCIVISYSIAPQYDYNK